MPELPEVETIRRIVARHLVGRQVAAVDVGLPKLLRLSPVPTLDPLVGCRVLLARRRAKVLVIDFSDDLSLMVHFKLAGQLAVFASDGDRFVAGHPIPDPAGLYPHKATHATFQFADGTLVYYSDVRQFGWLRLMATADVEPALTAFRFGPEAVGSDPVQPADLSARLARRSIPVKLALLDQTLLAGLGNIYVDEALHHAGIHPARPANGLALADIERLCVSVPWALERGIEQGGAKIIRQRAYPIDGFPRVHGRQGEPCLSCGQPITKTRLGSRGTYLCERCQPATGPNGDHLA